MYKFTQYLCVMYECERTIGVLSYLIALFWYKDAFSNVLQDTRMPVQANKMPRQQASEMALHNSNIHVQTSGMHSSDHQDAFSGY